MIDKALATAVTRLNVKLPDVVCVDIISVDLSPIRDELRTDVAGRLSEMAVPVNPNDPVITSIIVRYAERVNGFFWTEAVQVLEYKRRSREDARISNKGKLTKTGTQSRTEMGLGSFPLISLADACARSTGNKSMAMQGGDPLEAKRRALDAMTFAQALEHYLAAKLGEFRYKKHKNQWWATLNTYAAPFFGAMLLPTIDAPHLRCILEPIWAEKTETASSRQDSGGFVMGAGGRASRGRQSSGLERQSG